MSEINIVVVDNTGADPRPPSPFAVALSGMVLAEQPALLSNLAYSDQVASTDLAAKGSLSNQDALNKLQVSILAKAVNQVQNHNPMQARAVVDVLSNNEQAQAIADLKAAVNAFSGR